MIDVGTIGPMPSQVSLNKMLIELGDKRVTNIITSKYLRAKRDLMKLKKYILPNDLEFYDQMLEMVRIRHMDGVKAIRYEEFPMPKDVYTHWRCVMTGLFREAKRDILAGLKENVRRVQKGQQPL